MATTYPPMVNDLGVTWEAYTSDNKEFASVSLCATCLLYELVIPQRWTDMFGNVRPKPLQNRPIGLFVAWRNRLSDERVIGRSGIEIFIEFVEIGTWFERWLGWHANSRNVASKPGYIPMISGRFMSQALMLDGLLDFGLVDE